jgi:hypothetical protein
MTPNTSLLPVSLRPPAQGTASSIPFGVKRALGVSLGADVDRSYRLQAAGFHVDWSAIPSQITPMNRILIAEPTAGGLFRIALKHGVGIPERQRG